MIDMVEKTWQIVNQFTKNPSHVMIRDHGIDFLVKAIKEYLKNKHANIRKEYPKWMNEVDLQGISKDYLVTSYEFILDSINYNFWYGKHDIRSNGSSAHELSKMLDHVFTLAIQHEYRPKKLCSNVIYGMKILLSTNRYPNLENRLKHLDEVHRTFYNDNNEYTWFFKFVEDIESNGSDISINWVLENLISYYPTYASDMFLKRAFLFVISMYRRLGIFYNQINDVPIPADYQIPKMLLFYGAIHYESCLLNKVKNHVLIPSGSLEECEIRASSILACKLIADQAGCSMADVDSFLFSNRKVCQEPFHLTITTDY